MNIAVGFACLVAMVVTAGVTGLPEQQLAVGEQLDDYDDDFLERKGNGGCGTRMFCGIAGGRCQPKEDVCDGELRTNKFYCNGGKNCGCCIPRGPPGCVYGDKAFLNGDYMEETCIVFKCNGGCWEYQYLKGDCGDCNVWGDPHIIPYDPHSLINAPSNPIPHYYDYDIGLFVLSQPGLPFSSLFSVCADFEPCFDGTVTCVSRAIYSEPGIEVELMLPEKLFDSTYCTTVAHTDPKCLTKILVNKEERIIGENGCVSSFFGTDGTILIFKHSCSFFNCHIIIVGSKGYTVSLEVILTTNYYLDIYAMPSLHDQLYGLCGTFTGAPTSSFTKQNGEQIYNYNELNAFTESWRKPVIGRTALNKMNNGRKSTSLQFNGRYINASMVNEFGKQCKDITEGVCKVIPAEKCEAFMDTCILDMSRTGDRDMFVKGFIEYINDYSLMYHH